MSRQFLTSIDLAKNEFQNAAAHNLAAAPSTPVKGQLYMNTTDNTLYWWDGTTWQSAKAGAAFPGYGAVITETAFGQAANNGAATTVARSDHTHGTPTHLAADHSTIPINSLAGATGIIDMNGFKVTEVGDPTAATDAANKQYVDNLINGLSWKEPCIVATTANITLSGTQQIDGVTVAVGDRVLVKNQSTPQDNGIYVVAAGAWTRATDCDTGPEMEAAATFIQRGTTQTDTAWVVVTNAPITIGSTSIIWNQFASTSGAVPTTRQIISGNGLTGGGDLSADRTLAVVAADASIVVTADAVAVGYAGTGTTFGSAVTAARSDHHHSDLYPQTFAQDCSAGTTTTVTHGRGTRDLIVQVYRTTTPWDQVECDVEYTSTTQVTVRFAAAATAGQYRIVIHGKA